MLPALALAACASPGPRDTLAAYTAALARGDVDAIHALCATEVARDPEAIRRYLRDNPEAVAALVAALGAGPTREVAVLELAGGVRVELVREGSAWRVARGLVDPPRLGTPMDSLRTLFRALEDGDLAAVRRVIPHRHAADFASDALLLAHLAELMERAEAARARVPADAAPVVEGDRAELAYGPGLAVRFEREGDAWKIIDLE